MEELKMGKSIKLILTLIVSGLMITALAMVLVFAGVGAGGSAQIDSEETGGNAIAFAAPVLNADVIKEFSSKDLQYNETLKQWEAHKALDFGTTASVDVYCVLDGTVESISSPYLMGTTIVINHGNNLKTIYSSLDEEVNVQEGDVIKKGATIGKTSTSAQSEASVGNHLHFEVQLNGQKVDPTSYLTLENK